MNLLIFFFLIISAVYAQENKFNIADSINKFSLDLLAAVNLQAGDNLNVALSPLTLWTSLSVIGEGSYDNTAEEIDKVLNQPQNKNIVRENYVKFSKLLQQTENPSEAEFQTSTGIFTRTEFPVKQIYANIIKHYYDVSLNPVNFAGEAAEAAKIINQYVAKATNNRIPMLVTPVDVQNAYVFITSTLYFKGQWKSPFNKSVTQREEFLDDKKMKLGDVQMMFQSYPYAYQRMDKIKAHVVELPYGSTDEFSMVIFVPRGYQTLSEMLNGLAKESMLNILEKLEQQKLSFPEDDIHLYLPKFKITSDFNMEKVLQKLGIRDVFDSQKANLLGMFPHYLHLSRVIQKAEIEVDETGTVAAAAAGSVILNRSPPPVVKGNRPFAFFIVHKKSGSIIFAGKLSNPQKLT